MKSFFQIHKKNWFDFLLSSANEYNVFVPVKNNNHIEYVLIEEDTDNIVLNEAKPVTPLKAFFLPVKENVVIESIFHKKNMILGIPSCDLHALDLLDKMYLADPYIDPYYRSRRENTILIGTDCFEVQENCHCVSYGINPYPEKNCDMSIASLDDEIVITVHSAKGEDLINRLKVNNNLIEAGQNKLGEIKARRDAVVYKLRKKNASLPDYQSTAEMIRESSPQVWEEYSRTCVSCGACAVICPTCSCFLLVDRPDFEKIRQLDACQYQGFERIAAGEDPLGKKPVRFRNRYLCKYIWKQEKFGVIACTGCGRCIESCIGNINKNKIFTEMAENLKPVNH